MRVVDTSAWIERLNGSTAGYAVEREFPRQDECVVPTIVQLELSKWLSRGADERQAVEIIGMTRKCLVVPLNTTIALRAAELWREHKLATADAIVYATALEHDADLLTCDAHFENLPGVVFIRKRQLK
ncbi:MAG: type II toxin-antitoxin system VapC family toxin [Rudaea sp.]|uniref:type II toxin-antitoxin system VapC family toxin n=1 Tax=Rudaea sp. TaxID=2136325 RepID=UPI0039E5FAA0